MMGIKQMKRAINCFLIIKAINERYNYFIIYFWGGFNLRTINVEQITAEVAQMCKEAAYYLPKDVYEALKKGRETEESPVGQVVEIELEDTV